MIKTYINYPREEPHITLHNDVACKTVGQHHKKGQRIVQLDIASLSIELKHFKSKHYRFASDSRINDMLLEIDFSDQDFECAVVKYIKRLLTKHYKRFGRYDIKQHSCSEGIYPTRRRR